MSTFFLLIAFFRRIKMLFSVKNVLKLCFILSIFPFSFGKTLFVHVDCSFGKFKANEKKQINYVHTNRIKKKNLLKNK
jgi:hypothetical protein